MTLADMVNGVGIGMILLTVIQSTLSLYLFERLGASRSRGASTNFRSRLLADRLRRAQRSPAAGGELGRARVGCQSQVTPGTVAQQQDDPTPYGRSLRVQLRLRFMPVTQQKRREQVCSRLRKLCFSCRTAYSYLKLAHIRAAAFGRAPAGAEAAGLCIRLRSETPAAKRLTWASGG